MKNIQAFPRPYSKDDYGDYPVACQEQDGMTLRDYFAGLSLSGILGNSAVEQSLRSIDDICPDEIQIRAIAGACYDFADAMMEAREK